MRDEATVLKKDRDEAMVAVLESKTDQEYKDEYIDYFAFLLDPHLGLLHVDVADEIHRMPGDIGVDVTPANCRAPKPVNTGMGEVGP